jgi:mRNA-degrading endonuclease RelE of RelBE toxin-antitoxin system
MGADVVVTDQAREDIEGLKNVVITARIWKLIDRLKNWPAVSGAKALSGNLAGKFRMRTGDYRIQFRVVQTKEEPNGEETPRYTVIVERAGHRDGFYGD